MIKKLTALIVIFVALISVQQIKAQQVLDPANFITVDNLNDNNTAAVPGTLLCDDSTYCETRPNSNVAGESDGWWSNVSATFWYGGNSRRTSRLGGASVVGATNTHWFNVPVSDYWLVYAFMPMSPNASRNLKVVFKRFGEGQAADSTRWNSQDNTIISQGYGSWLPLKIIQVPAARKGLEVRFEADTLTPNIFRIDGTRILRSPQTGADIEFGKRPLDGQIRLPIVPPDTIRQNFVSHRLVEDFPQTTFKWNSYTDKAIPIYNIGHSDLVVTAVNFSSTRFNCVTPLPLTVQPGKESALVIRFSPKGEEVTEDSMVVASNDALEPNAILPVRGEGINYNFIMNASSGTEPHWNAPLVSGVAGYSETIGSAAWLNSVASPFAYPIPSGNSSSRVNTGTGMPTCTYTFQIPDTLAGKYILEYSGPQGSANAAQQLTVKIFTPFLTDTTKVIGFNSRIPTNIMWRAISDNNNRVFQLNGGGPTTVTYENPIQGGTELIRSDLLRIRLLPLAPTASTSADNTNRVLSYGSVSIYDSIRLSEFNYQRTLQIRSNGETPLVVDSIEIRGRDRHFFKLENKPVTPMTLPSVDGTYNLIVSMLPKDTVYYDTTWNPTRDTVRSIDTVVGGIRLYSSTLRMKTNDTTTNRYINITLSGTGIGTDIIVDDADPTTFVNTDIVDWNPQFPMEVHKWQKIAGSGFNNYRLFSYIYGYHYMAINPDSNYIEWFPRFPQRPGGPAIEADSFDVYALLPAGSRTGNPRAVYEIYSPAIAGGVTRIIKNQNSTTYGGQVGADGKLSLGRFIFYRGGQDIHGGGTIFGHVRLINNFAEVTDFYKDSLVNTALIDSHVTRADAIQFTQVSRTDVDEQLTTPLSYTLSQNYPNPFNPTTTIRFSIPSSDKVSLIIYDILGREVRTLVNADLKAGHYTYEWDGRNNLGSQIASGVYIYRMTAGKFVKTFKMMMLK